MLVLIAGITGMVGRPCAEAALSHGHSVRGLSRNPDKLPDTILSRLEGFEKLSNLYDLPALRRAVSGVDAVICAYTHMPEAVIEGQLLLLRMAEEAGVKIFHAASWNYDWSRGVLGQHEQYDCYISFASHVKLSSTIKPLYMFTGAITEWMFRNIRDKNWDPETKTLSYFGDANVPLRYTTADDLAEYTIKAISAPDAAEGGYIRVQSFEASPEDARQAYNVARAGKAEAHIKRVGSIEEAEQMLVKARETTAPIHFESYVGLAYVVHLARGTFEFEPEDCERFGVNQTSLVDWFKAHADV